MNIFLEQLTLIDKGHKLDGEVVNILIEKGKITKIGKKLKCPVKVKSLSYDKAYVSLGWLDLGTQIGEPGFENAETIESAARSAERGGFTALACFPNTNPVLDSKSQIDFVRRKSDPELVNFHPIGAISKGCAGDELSEFIDLAKHGAIAFSDGNKSVSSSKLMMLAMQYALSKDLLIINQPFDRSLSPDGLLHEGKISIKQGCQGIPDLAETLMLDRDLSLQDYSKSKYLAHLISSSASLEKLKKKASHQTYTSVSYLNLIKSEEDVDLFDAAYKVLPPLRRLSDKKALTKAVNKGQIDIICSNHVPVDLEHKALEFSRSAFGATGLETCFAALNTYQKDIATANIVSCLAGNPRRILGLENSIVEGQMANLTVFSTTEKWKYTKSNCQSLSLNNPFLDQELTGRAKCVINNNQLKVLTDPK